MSSRGTRRWRYLLPLLYIAALFYLGVIDMGPLPRVPLLATDKLLHAGCFLGLELLVEWAAANMRRAVRSALGVAVSITAGGMLELVQAGLPYRSADWSDLLADAVGACCGALLLRLLDRWFLSIPQAPGA